MPPGEPRAELSRPDFLPPPEILTPAAIHVWRFSDGDPGLLGSAERSRAAQFLSASAREAFVAGRSGVRRAASRYLGIPAGQVDLEEAESGKPHFPGGGLHFNISHSGGEVIAGFSTQPVGVDIDLPGRCRDFAAVAERFFEPEEAALCTSEEDFFRIWTAKEAIVKLSGAGLAGGLSLARTVGTGRGWLGGREVFLQRFAVGPCLGSIASFEPFEVKGWFQL